ncbi:hypothetical protein J3A83DRAFT_4186030 [Scleroderma citrinum]
MESGTVARSASSGDHYGLWNFGYRKHANHGELRVRTPSTSFTTLQRIMISRICLLSFYSRGVPSVIFIVAGTGILCWTLNGLVLCSGQISAQGDLLSISGSAYELFSGLAHEAQLWRYSYGSSGQWARRIHVEIRSDAFGCYLAGHRRRIPSECIFAITLMVLSLSCIIPAYMENMIDASVVTIGVIILSDTCYIPEQETHIIGLYRLEYAFSVLALRIWIEQRSHILTMVPLLLPGDYITES